MDLVTILIIVWFIDLCMTPILGFISEAIEGFFTDLLFYISAAIAVLPYLVAILYRLYVIYITYFIL